MVAMTRGSGGGSLTVIITGALLTPSAEARIDAVPAATAAATPAGVMDTTPVSLLDQVMVTSSRAIPPSAWAVAVKVRMSPTMRS